MTILEKKYNLFRLIDSFQSEKEIDKIVLLLEKYQENLSTVAHLVKPIHQKTDIQRMMTAQQYKGANFDKMQSLIQEMNIDF